jgi:hypothetical protein
MSTIRKYIDQDIRPSGKNTNNQIVAILFLLVSDTFSDTVSTDCLASNEIMILSPKIWTRDLQNMKQEYSSSENNVRSYLLTYLLTELSPSWEAANRAATQELPSISWNPKVQYSVHKSPPLVPIQSHINPIHSISSYLSKNYFSIVHPPTHWSS